MTKQFTVSVFTENKIGLMNRITIIFTRRRMNIERITVSESEVKGVARITIVVNTTRDAVDKLARQVEKLTEVLKAFVHEDHEVIYQEMALYKMSAKTLSHAAAAEFVKENNARILVEEPEYIVIEKTGTKEETEKLFHELEKFGVLEFARSGRVVVTKPMKELKTYLNELEIELV
ncbi:MAG: acetolactate synthase small subunit [Bacteroidia bacterium]|nr:acetolactate synthase small subunit [Bacteroidia bacterium]